MRTFVVLVGTLRNYLALTLNIDFLLMQLEYIMLMFHEYGDRYDDLSRASAFCC